MSIFLERQIVQKKRQWAKKLRHMERVAFSALMVIVGIAAIYGLYRFVVMGPVFQVRKLVVDGNWHYLQADQVAAASGVNSGDNLFWISVSDVYARLHSMPWIKEVAVRRKLPDTLYIFVEEYRPAAIVSTDDIYYVDDAGTLIKKVEAQDEKDYPVITGVELQNDSDDGAAGAGRIKEMLGIIQAFRATGFGGARDIAELNYDRLKGYSIITRREPMQILLGQSDPVGAIAQVDRISAGMTGRQGRIQYMLANEKGRVVVKYRPS